MVAPQADNKRIAINTVIIYIRMIVVTLISLFTTRYVLQALGVSDYGLYNVVAGLIAMLNVISTAMHTTTRRYINVEMGKPNGNLNKIFNVSLLLHIGFGLFVFLLAETIGIYYIYNLLNLQPGKLDDALFVFQISTIVSVIGLMNVPYQGLLCAYEKFSQIALIDFFAALLKIPLIILLVYYQGNALRFYAVGICIISLISFLFYQYVCYRRYHSIVSLRVYRDKSLYREILFFNNYTALGAVAYVGRSQGSTILINYFFGTFVNGAFAIAYQIESFVIMFVNNLGTASEPQITQSYSKGDIKRTFSLAENISKYSIFLMLVLIFPINLELDFLLTLWLENIPSGTLLLCRYIFVSLFIRAMAAGISPIIQASGKVKWFQISESFLMTMSLPVSFVLFTIGYPVATVILVYAAADLVNKIVQLGLLRMILKGDVFHFLKVVYGPSLKVVLFLLLYTIIYPYLKIDSSVEKILFFIIAIIYALVIIYFLGLTKKEQLLIIQKFRLHLKANLY